ncbi:CLOCK-interacting pacemaker-like [Carassius carassius]|uniref:CLOCK-interacting pacemaker-like n=1 Tax=Carassius carassius TaxID=217509 RepID=UPI002868B186|nr:CLOCK-interacting pacemaker-like [Carassius carassius]XP_059353844.1 CLOCK-interacting pacemaker-like [Carassius carassius]XP_059353845.1 CLOCK-interacting pacemaker-like [Carassius carassius]
MSTRMKDDGRSRAMARVKNKRMEKSKLESERDSGFSDGGSEHLSVDRDDASSSRSQLTLQSLSPVIFMNNVLLKQSGETPSSLKPWAFSPAVVPQSQVVFLQPVVPQRSGPVPKGPPSKRRRHRKYLPILKSYPKIAPHPGDAGPKISSSSGSPRGQKDSLPSALPASEPTDGSPQTLDTDAHSLNTDSKIKRFCNTYNILSKSGLLDITLRTKELIRQNRRTQTELDLLREHTDLFMQALQTGDSVIWSRLLTSTQEQDHEKHRTVQLK